MKTVKIKRKFNVMTDIAEFISGECRRVSIDEIRSRFHMLSVNARGCAMYRLRCVPGLLEVTGVHPYKEYFCSPIALQSFIDGQIKGYATVDKRLSGKKSAHPKREAKKGGQSVRILRSGGYSIERLPGSASSVFDYARVVNL